MVNIDFDAIKTKIKRDAHPLLSGITIGDKMVYKMHHVEPKKRKKKKQKKVGSNSRRYLRGYLGAWCPWWMPYDVSHGQHDPKFDPPQESTPSVPDAPGPVDMGGGAADASGAVPAGGVSGGGALAESTMSGFVIGESADNGLFFESADDAVGYMISSRLVEVAPETSSDTAKMLTNGVADAISCYTPMLPKKHPFRVFKVEDVPTEKVHNVSVITEAEDGLNDVVYDNEQANPNERVSATDIEFEEISPTEAEKLVKTSPYNVHPFSPHIVMKCLKWNNPDVVVGAFRKGERDKALAVITLEDMGPGLYLSEMAGFIKGAGKALIQHVIDKYDRVWGQVQLIGSGDKDSPYAPNPRLEKFYRGVDGLEFYTVADSSWGCPALFIYKGIPMDEIGEFLETTYGAKKSEDDGE